jgi:hypothetical protein
VLVRPAAGGERLEASFSRYPLPFSPVFTSHVARGVSGLGAEELPVPAPEAKPPGHGGGTHELRLSGSKTVGFSVGSNKDLGIDQSLRITMVGKLAPDLEVNAFLTDDNLPITPEGNTEELKQLDKVYVQVRSKHSEVQMGDFSSGLSWSRFSTFQRELRGMSAKVGAADQLFFAGGGVAKGKFKTASFHGREGVQGPYQLLAVQQFNGVIILPGTESVYLDGRLLKRGSENDYTIDYILQTVTFTERVPVTDDSEIVIDYQMGEDAYQRTTLTGGWTSPEYGKALRLRTLLFQESDDASKPAFGALTTQERGVLALAGDDPAKALSSGVEQVDAGLGEYVLVPADSVPAHFLFVETGGTFHADFHQVTAGAGDYRTDGFSSRGVVRYRFVGAGSGDFALGRLLPLPRRTRLFTIGATAEKGVVYLDAEGDFSWRDENVLSKLSDNDNAAHAMRVEGGLKGVKIPSAALSVLGNYSTLEDRFASPDKPRESYFYRDWGLDNIPLVGTETIGGAKLLLQGVRPWSVDADFSSLSRGAALKAHKTDVQAAVGDADSRGMSLRAFDSRAGEDRERRFAQGSGVISFWHLVPRLTLETERYRSTATAAPDTGRYYKEGALALGARRIGPYRGVLSVSRRETDNLAASGVDWFHARRNDEISFDGGYAEGPRVVDLLVTHRRSLDIPSSASDWFDLARVRARDTWDKAGMATDVSYRLTSGAEMTRDRAVIFVGRNQGDFDQNGREVGQKRGDYTLLFLPSDSTEAVHTVELDMHLSVGSGVRGIVAGRGSDGLLSKLRREVSLDHFFSVLEKSRTSDLLGLYTLRPSLLQRSDLTVYGIDKLREELGLFNSSKAFKLRFTYSREDEDDDRSAGAAFDAFTRDVAARVESVPVDALAITWEVGMNLRERQAQGAFAQNFRVNTHSVSQTLDYRLNPSTKLSFELGLEKRSDAVSAAKQTSYIAAPSVTSSVGQRVSLAALLRITYTNVESNAGKPLFFLEQGTREDWSVNGQYRFTRNVSFGVNYTGFRERDFLGEVRTVHDFKMESRAYF